MRGSGRGYAGGGIRKDVKDARGYTGPYSHLARVASVRSIPQSAPIPQHVGVTPVSAPSPLSSMELQMLRLRELVIQSEMPRDTLQASPLETSRSNEDIIIEPNSAESTPSEHPVLDPQESQHVLSLDLHFFDGKVETAVSWIMPDIVRVKNIDPEVKKYGISQLRERITAFPFQIPEAIQSYDILSSSPDSSNTDPITNVNAYDLLYILYERVVLDGKEDCMDTLITQLSDMQTGMCVQGRVTRLLQVIVMFDNFV